MQIRNVGLRGVMVLLAMLATWSAWSQGPVLPREIIAARELTPAQKAEVAAFVAHWVRELSSDVSMPDAYTRISNANRALGSNIFRSPEVSVPFRVAYSEALVPQLQQLLNGPDAASAARAMNIAARLGTDAALNLLINEIASPDAMRRNAAARGARLAVQDFQVGSARSVVTPAAISTLVRKVEQAALEEASPFALQRQVEVLDAVFNASLARPDVLQGMDAAVQDARIRVLAAQAARIAPHEADTLTMMVATLRAHYQATPSRQANDGPRLASAVNTILATCLRDWEEIRRDPTTLASFQRLVEDSENFLIFIDSTIRSNSAPPRTQLKQSWQSNDKQRFKSDHEQWAALLQREPYRR